MNIYDLIDDLKNDISLVQSHMLEEEANNLIDEITRLRAEAKEFEKIVTRYGELLRNITEIDISTYRIDIPHKQGECIADALDRMARERAQRRWG